MYVEKPLTHDLAEGQAVIDAQNKHKRVVQVGTQQRSMPQFQKAEEIVRSGQLGKIHKVHLTWNRNTPRGTKGKLNIDPKTVDWKRFLGNARSQPFDEYRFRNWRWFWDFGGGIFTDLMVHFIDVAHWFLDLDHPQVAASIGDHFMAKDLWETPDTVQTLLRYPDKELQVYFEGTFVNARNAAMIEFMGSDATLYLDRGRYEIHPERNKPHQGQRAGDRQRPARRRFLRRARRRAVAPDQLGGVRPQPQEAQLPGRGRRERRLGRAPGEYRAAARGSGAVGSQQAIGYGVTATLRPQGPRPGKLQPLRLERYQSYKVRPPLPVNRAWVHIFPSLLFGCLPDCGRDSDHPPRLVPLEDEPLLAEEAQLLGRRVVKVVDQERHRLVQLLAIHGVHEQGAGLDLAPFGQDALDGQVFSKLVPEEPAGLRGPAAFTAMPRGATGA